MATILWHTTKLRCQQENVAANYHPLDIQDNQKKVQAGTIETNHSDNDTRDLFKTTDRLYNQFVGRKTLSDMIQTSSLLK